MITITDTGDTLTVKGHAGHAPKGFDIVCAAVSALAETLAAATSELTDARAEISTNDGDMKIVYRNATEGSDLLKRSFLLGAGAIAESYPECVKLTVR